MKELNSFIQEKLVINKNIKPQYSNIYGEGNLVLFKDCNIYKTQKLKIEDKRLETTIKKYFNNNEEVFVVTYQFQNGQPNPLPDKLLNEIQQTSSILQRIFLMDYQRGYYLKKLESNNQIVLVIKDFKKRPMGIKSIQYIFKIK